MAEGGGVKMRLARLGRVSGERIIYHDHKHGLRDT